jgi:hypothetical protein
VISGKEWPMRNWLSGRLRGHGNENAKQMKKLL